MGLKNDIWSHRELLGILIQRNIKIRYKGTALGFFWTLLSPVLLILIYAVFLRILRFSISLPILVTGIIAWQFLATCLGDSLHAVIGNANLVKKTAFPRAVLPLSMVLANAINFLLSMVVLTIYVVVMKTHFGNPGWLILGLISQCALCLGVALMFSALNVFFRDLEHSLQIFTMAWFFLTPVVYPLSFPLSVIQERFPAVLRWLYFLNPMSGIVSSYRMTLLSVDQVHWSMLAVSFAMSWVVLLLGLLVFQGVQKRFADEL